MRATETTIPSEVMDVLGRGRIEGAAFYLPAEQLDRKLYTSVNEVLTRCGGKWNTKQKAHLFPTENIDSLAQVIESGTVGAKNPDAYFPTPDAVILSMIQAAGPIGPDTSILEPSAGEGAIANLVYEQTGAKCCVYEIDNARSLVLCATQCNHKCYSALYQIDFLKVNCDPGCYDRVLMNPPFSVESDKQAYIAHIEHAWKFLKPGGILVAIAPNGFTFRDDKRVVAFKEFVEQYGEWEELETGAFKESGTMTNTVMITMRKPD